MGRHIQPGQEATVLRELIAEARRITQGLDTAIKQAKELEPALVSDFEQIHATEIARLSNYIAEESNRHAAELNAELDRVRKMIIEEIMAGQAVFDRHTMTVTIKWPGGRFDDRQPLPYPHVAPKETQQ